MVGTSMFAGAGMAVTALLVGGLFGPAPAEAQSSASPGYSVGNIDHGLVVGVIAGVAAVVGIGIAYLVLHNRGVVTGCVVEGDGKRTLVDSDKKVYLLDATGAMLTVGDQVKGHGSGPSADRSLRVEKVVKDYGPCPV